MVCSRSRRPVRDLVRIGLVAHIPDQLVTGGVIHIVQGDRQLDRAQPGGEVAAAGADALDQEFAQLRGQFQAVWRPVAAAGPRGDWMRLNSG